MRGDISGRPERDASPPETAVEHQLRRAILAAAIDELQKWSFERFSVETVADRAAVDPDVVHRLWKSKEQLMVNALVDHCDQIVVVPHTGSMRTDLAGHLASLAEYFNTAIGRSLLRTGVIGPNNWAPARVRGDLWQANVDAVCVIFERAQHRSEIAKASTTAPHCNWPSDRCSWAASTATIRSTPHRCARRLRTWWGVPCGAATRRPMQLSTTADAAL